MPLYINTNIASLNAQRNLLSSTGELNKVFARLSSGLRINSAGDDAAGLAISNRMTAQIRGLNQSIRNANDGISVSQVAEGAMDETSNMLQRINELAVQAANGTNSDSDRQNLQEEIDQLLNEIERIAQQTEFNGWPVLNGETDPLVFQVGDREGRTITVELADARADTLMAQPQLADPNSSEGIYNPTIDGLKITAPETQLAGSRLFSSTAAQLVHVVANATSSDSELGSALAEDVANNMFTVLDNDDASTLAEALEEAIASPSPTLQALIDYGDETVEASQSVDGMVDSLIEELVNFPDANLITAVQTAVKDVINDGIGDSKSASTISTELQAVLLTYTDTSSTVHTDEALVDTFLTETDTDILAAAALAMQGLTADGSTVISGGGSVENAIGALIGVETITDSDSTVTSDQARVIGAATYAANKTYTTEGVPTDYKELAGDTTGLIATTTTGEMTEVVDRAIEGATISGTTIPARVDDVPVGNIMDVIAAFDSTISANQEIEEIAAAAVEADQSGRLTLAEAKIIAAAGLAAADPSGTVAKAATAAQNMSLVLAARDAAAAAAGQPTGGEMITVPEWMIDTSGSNSFPPDPLVDVTGASIPTDPTLEFDPPMTDATNPALSGQDAAGRMISTVLAALDRVSSTRAEMGAVQNRFESNIANFSNVVENVSAGRSRILDADIAEETASLTRLAIMQQAGTAILAQANQQPQLALQLLG
jgi:flagellin